MPWSVKLGMVVLILGTGFSGGWAVNGWRLEARIADLKEGYSRALAEYYKAAREREKRLVEASDKLKEDKDAQIRSINARFRDAINRLHNRPDRLPDPSPACRGTTGVELSRPDAEFLERFSRDAAETEAKLNYCIDQYNSARKMLE